VLHEISQNILKFLNYKEVLHQWKLQCSSKATSLVTFKTTTFGSSSSGDQQHRDYHTVFLLTKKPIEPPKLMIVTLAVLLLYPALTLTNRFPCTQVYSTVALWS